MPSKRAAATSRALPTPPPSRASGPHASELPRCCDATCALIQHCMLANTARRPHAACSHHSNCHNRARQARHHQAASWSTRRRCRWAAAHHRSRTQPCHCSTLSCLHRIAPARSHASQLRSSTPQLRPSTAQLRLSTATPRGNSTAARLVSTAASHEQSTAPRTQPTLTLCRQVAACSLRACRRPHACKSHRRPAQATSTLRFCR